jgi:hypothetical protein
MSARQLRDIGFKNRSTMGVREISAPAHRQVVHEPGREAAVLSPL